MKVSLGSSFVDERGIIQNIINASFNHVGIITSKKGCTRSNHYHLTNSHYMYIISGKMEYWERDLNSDIITMDICEPGEMVFTGSKLVHKTVFLEDTVMMTFAANYRGPEFDKNDTVKMEF
jgi:dTDP-4-dehydrorhamnose 3,5-epimerase-like enzyme